MLGNMHKFYDYEPNWIFNWDTNEPINFSLCLPKRTRQRAGNMCLCAQKIERATEIKMKRIKVLFAIFMHDMVSIFRNPPDHLANYLEFI